MTRVIIVNGTELSAYDWTEAPDAAGEGRHARDAALLEGGVEALGSGEVSFLCDQTLAFDTLFETKGDGRKFVILAGEQGRHVAKPY